MLSVIRAILNAVAQFIAYSMKLLLWPFLMLTGLSRSGSPEPPGLSTFQETIASLSNTKDAELEKSNSFDTPDQTAKNVREFAFLLSTMAPEDRKVAAAGLQFELPDQIRTWLMDQNSDHLVKIATSSLCELKALLANTDFGGSAYKKKNSQQPIRPESPIAGSLPPYIGGALRKQNSSPLTFQPDRILPSRTNDTFCQSPDESVVPISSGSTRR
jgi:hypothetical protein